MYSMGGLNKLSLTWLHAFCPRDWNFQHMTVVCCGETGLWVVVPSQGHEATLQEFHSGYLGICRMRSLARMYVWWLGMDSEIEKTECQAVHAAPPLAPLKVTPGPF